MEENPEDAYVKPGAKSYIWTYGANFMVVIASFLSYHFCSTLLGQEDFEVFAVAKRLTTCGAAIIATGWGVSLTYHVATDRSKNGNSSLAYLGLATRQVGLFLILLLVLVLVFPEHLALALLGNADYADHLRAIFYDFWATSAQCTLNCYFLGLMQAKFFSILTILCSAVFPLICFFVFRDDLVQYFYGRGTVTALATLLFYLGFVWRSRVKTRKEALPPGESATFFKYAAVRMPGSFLVAFILILPVSVATHASVDLERAAALSIGMALVSVVAAGVTPLSSLYLPQAAFLKSRGEAGKLKASVGKVIAAVVVSCLLYIGLLETFLEPFLTLLLGKELTGFESVIRLCLPAALPYAIFRCFYGFLDGAHEQPLVTYNALVSIGVFAIAGFLSWKSGIGDPSIVGFLAASTCLGLLALAQTFWVLGQSSEKAS